MPTDIARKRILTQLVALPRQSVNNGGSSSKQGATNSFCALVVDAETLAVLSSAARTYDLLDNGISVIESICKSRQPLPELDCIYFLSPTRDSVERLVQDFKYEKKASARTVHLFWSVTIATQPELMEMIAECPPLVNRIKTFVDFNLHFRAYESRVFHLGMPMALTHLFARNSVPPDWLLRTIAARLATVCITMNEYPSIRFMNGGPNAALNRQVAQFLQDYIDNLRLTGLNKGRCELIILDRSVDCCSLLVHEYTYQALAYDVLEIPVCLPNQATTANAEGRFEDTYRYLDDKKETRNALLSENDELYMKYRHKHIASVITGVNEELKKFSKDNAAAKYTKKGGGGGAGGTQDIASAIRALPQYTEMLQKFMTHISMSESCFSTLNQTGIFRAGILEQDLATGVDKHGKAVQVLKILEELAKLVSDKSGIIMFEKVRLLLLYFSMMDGVQEEDKKKMIRAAGMSLEIERLIETFCSLKLVNDSAREGGASGGAASSLKHVHRIHKNEEALTYYKKRAKSAQYELSRYEPAIKEILESAANKRLSRSNYPYLQDPEFKTGFQPTHNNIAASGGGRIRAAQLDWDWDSPDDVSPTSAIAAVDDNIANIAKAPTGSSSKPKLIVFCLGGISFSEIRSTYEVTRSSNAELFIGGTSIVTPPMLFEVLKITSGTHQTDHPASPLNMA